MLATVRQFLSAESTLVLSTVTSLGEVRSAPLFYLLDDRDFVLYWLSSNESEHSVNLVGRPDCAATVFRLTENWREIAGVQMTGVAATVPDSRREPIVTRYCERFRLEGALEAVIAQSALFQFRPTWARYIDNAKGFGYKFEVRFTE